MYMVVIALVVVVIILGVICLYKTRIIQDYETRLPKLYQEFVDDCIRCKEYLDFQDRSSREPNVRKELNYMIDKYSGYFRKQKTTFDKLIKSGAEEYIKKN